MKHRQKVRLTTIRQVILEELTNATSHPTANEVYELVRERLPRIGLRTVYRNLDFLADSGVILRIELGGTPKRFDASSYHHYHVRCSSCGKVEIINIPFQLHINDAVLATNCCYDLLMHHIEFTGVCKDCQQKGRRRQQISPQA